MKAIAGAAACDPDTDTDTDTDTDPDTDTGTKPGWAVSLLWGPGSSATFLPWRTNWKTTSSHPLQPAKSQSQHKCPFLLSGLPNSTLLLFFFYFRFAAFSFGIFRN